MTKEVVKHVLIVGCGIAGPALAIFLRRLGLEVTICEARADETRDMGAFLGIAPNGMNILVELGIADRVETASVPCHGFEFRNARDQVIASMKRADDAGRYGARLQMMRRARLHEVLTDAALERGVRVHFDRTLTSIARNDGSSVVAHFESSTSQSYEARADLLIGCDGIRSRTRTLAFRNPVRPDYSGLVDVAGFAPGSRAPLEVGLNVLLFGRRAFFGAFKTPEGEAWWFHNSGEKSPEQLRMGSENLRRRSLDLHRDDPLWVREVIEATPAILGPYALHDILSMPQWYEGRVCLIGDAAHATTPSSGQGASLALEDSLVLAQSLRDIGDPERAFAAFQRARQSRVEEIVEQSRRIGRTKAIESSLEEWLRDRLLPLFLRFGRKAMERQYGYRVRWEAGAGG